VPPAEQVRLDRLYNQYALQEARHIKAFGLQGEPVLTEAQRLIGAGSPVWCEARPRGGAI
jgi:hypothetical protein